MTRSCLLCALAALIVLGLGGLYLSGMFNLPANEYKNYVISGYVIPAEGASETIPSDVLIYYPQTDKAICESKMLQAVRIKTTDNKTGSFEAYLKIPVGLKRISLTTDCGSCEYSTVDLNVTESHIDTNLTWGKNSCNNYAFSDQLVVVSNQARERLDGIRNSYLGKPFNDSEVDSILEAMRYGGEAISDSNNPTDKNQSLLMAYTADFYAWNAYYRISLFDLKYCLKDINASVEEHRQNVCYIPEYIAYEDYQSVNSSYFSQLANPRLMNVEHYVDTDNLTDVKGELAYLRSQRDDNLHSLSTCKNALEVINGTFEYQRPYCEARLVLLRLDYFFFIVFFVSLGILIEKGRKIWKK